MKQYLDLLRDALSGERQTNDRTGAGTVGVYQRQARFDLEEGFPAVTTKPLYFSGVVGEALWFLRGETNIRSLLQDRVGIWSSDALRFNLDHVLDSGLFTKEQIENARVQAHEHQNYRPAKEILKDFEQKILEDEEFAAVAGELGPVYGAQWRGSNGASAADQIASLEESLANGGTSRRMIVDAWNSAQVGEMALPPCHLLWQVHVSPESQKLTLGWYQRSCDTVLGVPFNIASYGLIAELLAHTHGYGKGELIGNFGDLHVYLPHLPAAEEQLAREPRPLPKLDIKTKRGSVTEYEKKDIALVGYEPHPPLSHPTPMFGGFF